MSITNLDEFYSAVRHLVGRLREGGEMSWADSLDEALRSGAVGSETLGNLWLALLQIRYPPA